MKILTAILIVIFPLTLSAVTYYVDADAGLDANPGTSPEQAWQTLTKVNSVTFSPGDNILFKGGCTWTGKLIVPSSGNSSAQITFGSYGTGRGHIKGLGTSSAKEAVLVKNVAYVTIENLEISHPTATHDPLYVLRGIHIEANLNKNYPGIIIRNNEVRDVEGYIMNDRWRTGGIFARSAAPQGRFDNLLIEDNYVHDCTVRGIQLGEGSNEDPQYYHKNVIIRNNYVDNTGMEGIKTHQCYDLLIEYNTVYRAGNYLLTGNLDGAHLAALWGCSYNMTIQYNEVAYTQLSNPSPWAGMDSQAFDIDVYSEGFCIIQYNYSHDNEGGFFLSMGQSAPDFGCGIIRYNISQNDGNGMNYRTFELHSHLKNRTLPMHFYNNVFYNDTKVWVMDRSNGNGAHPGLEFYNNIFYAPAGQYDDQASIVYNNNLYYSHTPPAADANALTGNPRLINPGSGTEGRNSVDGYQIKSNSPCIAAGVIMSDNGGLDYFLNSVPSDTKPDIGAHQLNATIDDEHRSTENSTNLPDKLKKFMQ